MENNESIEPMVTPAEKKAPDFPQTLDKYDIRLPAVPAFMRDPQYRQVVEDMGWYLANAAIELKVLAHEFHLSNTAAQKIVNHFVEKFTEAFRVGEEYRLEQRAKTLAVLKKEWKGDFAANEELARRAISRFGGVEMAQEIAEAGFADHPSMIKIFYGIGKAMAGAS